MGKLTNALRDYQRWRANLTLEDIDRELDNCARERLRIMATERTLRRALVTIKRGLEDGVVIGLPTSPKRYVITGIKVSPHRFTVYGRKRSLDGLDPVEVLFMDTYKLKGDSLKWRIYEPAPVPILFRDFTNWNTD